MVPFIAAARRLALLATGLTLLASCGDAVWNAMTGEHEMNIPLRTEGDWQGRTSPAQGRVVRPCLPENADVHLQVRGETVTGYLLNDQGRRLEIRGAAWAGAEHTGRNSINGTFWAQDRYQGAFYLSPAVGMGMDYMRGSYVVSGHCNGSIGASRVPG